MHSILKALNHSCPKVSAGLCGKFGLQFLFQLISCLKVLLVNTVLEETPNAKKSKRIKSGMWGHPSQIVLRMMTRCSKSLRSQVKETLAVVCGSILLKTCIFQPSPPDLRTATYRSLVTLGAMPFSLNQSGPLIAVAAEHNSAVHFSTCSRRSWT